MMQRVGMMVAVVAGLWAASAPAAPASFLGGWTITGSVRAPGIAPDAREAPAEIRRLSGARLLFSTKAIAGPRPLACRRPHYVMKDYSPDMLFQGTLTDAGRQAAALGFVGSTVRTLETGCDGALDFHFTDAATAKFMLDNRIYTIRRDRH